MVEALAIALAVESDGSLRAQLRKLAQGSDGQTFMVTQFGSGAWLKLGTDPRVTVYREWLDGLATFDLALAPPSNPSLTEALERVLSRTASAAATKLLDPVWNMEAMPSHEQSAVLVVAPTRAAGVQKWYGTIRSARLNASRDPKDSHNGCGERGRSTVSLLGRSSRDGQFDLVGLGRPMSPMA